MRGYGDGKPTVTFPAVERQRALTGTKLYCMVTGAQWCEQLAHSRYAAAPSPRVESATIYTPFTRNRLFDRFDNRLHRM